MAKFKFIQLKDLKEGMVISYSSPDAYPREYHVIQSWAKIASLIGLATENSPYSRKFHHTL